MICRNCGNDIGEEEKFCKNCGAPAEEPKAQEPVQQTPAQGSSSYTETYNADKNSGKKRFELNVKSLIWSILNLMCCCQPLGIAGLIFTILASNATNETDNKNKSKYANICNLIGMIGGVIALLAIILYYVFVIVLMVGSEI